MLSLKEINLIALILLLSSCNITEGVIKYGHSPLYKDESIDLKLDSELDSVVLKTHEKIAVLEKDNERKKIVEEYLFTKDKIRIKRKTRIPQERKFHLYYPDKLISVLYKERKNGEIAVDTFNYIWKVNPDWEVKYQVVEFKKNLKKINGYKCNFRKIIEEKESECLQKLSILKDDLE